MRKYFALFVIFTFLWSAEVRAESWQEIQGKHFIVQYDSEVGAQWANHVLREAERYYNKIALQIGYKRYQDFWTWDDRARIIIFSDQETFSQRTGVPSWSRGFAVRDQNFFQTRTMVAYKQEVDFLDGVLPHEITHLIIGDLMHSQVSLPLWFEEGVAQYQEKNKKKQADYVMRQAVRRGQYLAFDKMFVTDIRHAQDPIQTAFYYAQSVSIIEFLITKHGSKKFGQLITRLKERESFEQALLKTYLTAFRSINELEKKWLSYIQS